MADTRRMLLTQDGGKTVVRSVDLTPTWLGILPGLLAVIANGETVEARQAAEVELRRMASLADRYVALQQEGDR